MKIIKGNLEFFYEIGISSAVIRTYSSKGGFDGVLALKPGDKLVVFGDNKEIIFEATIVLNKELMIKTYSAVIIPVGIDKESWFDILRNKNEAELYIDRNINF